MKITKVSENGIPVLLISGQLAAPAAAFFEEALGKGLGDKKEIILDFSGVEFIASAVLRVLLSVEKKLKLQNGGITIRNANSVVTEVFNLTGIKDFIKVI